MFLISRTLWHEICSRYMKTSTMDFKTYRNTLLNRTDGVNSYLRDINKYPILSNEENVALYFEAIKGNTDAQDKLIMHNQRFVFKIAKIYAADDEGILDLVDVGNIGFIKSIHDKKFNPELGNAFLTYAIWYIRREIVYYLTTVNTFIKKTNNSKTALRINPIKNKFYAENGRFPTEEEIIDIFDKKFGVKIQDINDVFEIKTESINSTFDDDDANAFENSYDFTSKSASYNEYETTMNAEDNKEKVKALLSALNERDRTVVKLAFGIDCDKEFTNQEIGEELDLSPERVRQIIKQATEKLKRVSIQYKY